MPIELIVISVIVLGLAFAIIFFKVPAFAAMFSLLVGQILSSEASSDVYGFLASVTKLADYRYIQVALLVIPFVLTVFFLKGRVDKSRLALEILPALTSGVALLLLLYPLLPIVKNALDIASGDSIADYRSFTLIFASVLGLVSVWISVPKKHHEAKHHEK